MSCWAIVVAGGRGLRFGARKQFQLLAGRPVIDWAMDAALAACDGVVLVVPADQLEEYLARPRRAGDGIVAGGDTRSESVRAGLAVVPLGAEVVVVHDAARPLARPETWSAVIGAVVAGADAAIPAVAVSDTIKMLDANGSLITLDRRLLVAVQTPQAFEAAILRAAHAGGAEATDDAALVEALGGRVVTVPGSHYNMKITAPDDLVVAEALLAASGPVEQIKP